MREAVQLGVAAAAVVDVAVVVDSARTAGINRAIDAQEGVIMIASGGK